MVDAPERIWAERDPGTDEKRWFSIKGMGVEYLRADLAAVPEGEPVAYMRPCTVYHLTGKITHSHVLCSEDHPDAVAVYTHPAPHPDIHAPADKAEERREALEEAEAVAENELQEIADGAWGDNPARRGAARALISTPARREGE